MANNFDAVVVDDEKIAKDCIEVSHRRTSTSHGCLAHVGCAETTWLSTCADEQFCWDRHRKVIAFVVAVSICMKQSSLFARVHELERVVCDIS